MAIKRLSNRPVLPPHLRQRSDIISAAPAEAHPDSRLADYGERIIEALKDGEKTLPSISHYDLVEELGQGGMGTVFLADHVSEGGIKKKVAIKVLRDTTDGSAIKKFVEEAQLLAQLAQGTIVELLALESIEVALPGTRDPRTGRLGAPKKSKLYFMVMEYVNGPGLDTVIRRHADNTMLPHPPIVGFILNKAVIALAEAHTLTDAHGKPLGLAHRDISPSNILFNAKAGITKLADFGVAKAFGDDGGGGERKLVGKPRYMAPEQLEGQASPASDIWALGVIGYEALTGFSPYRLFGRDTHEKVEFLKRQMEFALRPPKEVIRSEDERFELDKLSDIVMLCLHPSPSARPTSLELNAMLEGQYLYSKGLGPTNKTLAAYLKLSECGIGDGELVPPPEFAGSEDEKVICATLWVKDALSVFKRRSGKAYHAEFLQAAKDKHANPCLMPDENGGVFQAG